MLETCRPMDIEARSFEIITELLGDRKLDPENAPVIKRAIHTTADFDYADNLVFSPHAVQAGLEALRAGCDIVTDTQMAKAGINKTILASLGGEVHCFMSDPDVAAEAKSRGVTRAWVSMEKAAQLKKPCIFAIGNAPTALVSLDALMAAELLRPALLIGVLRKVFIMYGLSMTSPIDGSIIDTIVPLLVLLLSVLLGMDRFTELKVAGLLLGMAGAVAVVLTGASSSHQHSHVWGNVMIMLCACATALYMVWFKALVARYRITTVLRWVYCVAAVVALPFGLKEIIHTDYAAIAGHALFPTLFVLTVPTYLPNLMLNYALKSVPATVSSIYTYLQPVLAIAISVGMGLDKLHADTVVFALVIFVGVGLVLRSYSVPPRHPDPPAAPPH